MKYRIKVITRPNKHPAYHIQVKSSFLFIPYWTTEYTREANGLVKYYTPVIFYDIDKAREYIKTWEAFFSEQIQITYLEP